MKSTNLVAGFYDCFMGLLDLLLGINKWRARLWSEVEGPRILDAGAGTGLNIPYYRPGWLVVVLDRSELFLKRARIRAEKVDIDMEFIIGDVKELPFDDRTFDSVVATFLLCQLDNPLQALAEIYRVLKPGGRLLLLEHVRSKKHWGRFMDYLSGPVYRLFGDNIAGDPVILAKKCGFTYMKTENFLLDVIKFIKIKKDEIQ